MTRYLCVDPRHRRGDEARPVDLSAQVRLERELLPRTPAYLCVTEHVISAVQRLPELPRDRRVSAVEEIITGTAHPTEAAVVMVSDRSVERAPGLYELDDLRRSDPRLDALAGDYADVAPTGISAGDLVVIESEPPSPPTATAGPTATTEVVASPPIERARVVPQGVFDLHVIAERLADAKTDEAALIEAIRHTPSYASTASLATVGAWQVVVPCPIAEGEPPQRHRTVFTGTGAAEPAVVYGTPAGGWEIVLEHDGSTDLAPAHAVARQDRRLRALVIGELVLAVGFVLVAWWAGGLTFAARETPGWVGFAAALFLGSLAFAGVALFAPARTDGNPNDTLVVGGFYRSRMDMLNWAAVISVTLFALAVLAAVIPPAIASEPATPAATITFDTSGQPVIATTSMLATGVASGRTLSLTVRQFGVNDTVGTVVGRSAATADATGRVSLTEAFALDATARYVSAQVTVDGEPTEACTPQTVGLAGCTLAAVPPLGAGITTPSPSVSPTAFPTAAASPVAEIAPSAPAAVVPTPTISVPSAAPTTSPSPVASAPVAPAVAPTSGLPVPTPSA